MLVVREHYTYDEWTQNIEWRIEYFEIQNGTRTDVEFLEAHLISLYRTDKWFNKSKAGWGISSYLPTEFNWCEYVEDMTENAPMADKKKERELRMLEFSVSYFKEHEKRIAVAYAIRECLPEKDYKNCPKRGYSTIRIRANLEDVIKYKNFFHPDCAGSEFYNMMPSVIDVSRLDNYDGVNNIEIILFKRGVMKTIEDNIQHNRYLREKCIKDARNVFVDDTEYKEFIMKEIG